MPKSSLCYFSDEYMLVMGRITITRGPENTNDGNEWRQERNKGVILKKCCTIYWLHKQNKQYINR